MKKYVLEVLKPEEGFCLIYEINISSVFQGLSIHDVHHLKQALDDKEEIRIKSISSKELARLNESALFVMKRPRGEK